MIYEITDVLLKYFDGEITDEECDRFFAGATTPNERTHGPLVDVRQEAYYDWYIYADGYEEANERI